MSNLAICLVLISAFFHALKSFFLKRSKDKFSFLFLYYNISILVYLPLLIYFVLSEGVDWVALFFWGMVSGVCHFFYMICFAKAMEKGDLSLVYPIIRSSPALVLVCAVFFLGEDVSIRGVLGISLIVFGVYSINLDGLSFQSLSQPLMKLYYEPSLQWGLLTMLTVTAYSIVDKQGAITNHPMIFACALPIFSSIYFSPYFLARKDNSKLRVEWDENKRDILINSVICVGGYNLIIVAMSFEKLSYVVGLRQVSIVMAVIMGGMILREKNYLVRVFASCVIFVGAFLIASAGK